MSDRQDEEVDELVPFVLNALAESRVGEAGLTQSGTEKKEEEKESEDEERWEHEEEERVEEEEEEEEKEEEEQEKEAEDEKSATEAKYNDSEPPFIPLAKVQQNKRTWRAKLPEDVQKKSPLFFFSLPLPQSLLNTVVSNKNKYAKTNCAGEGRQ